MNEDKESSGTRAVCGNWTQWKKTRMAARGLQRKTKDQKHNQNTTNSRMSTNLMGANE